MRLNFGLREKLLAPVVSGGIVIVLLLLFVLQPIQLKNKKEEFLFSQTNLVKTLTPSIIQNILSNDLSELHSLFENSILIHKEQWRYIELRDPDKKLLYPVFPVIPVLTNTLLSIKIIIEENDEIFGYVTLYTDWQKTKDKEIEKINQLNMYAIFLFLLVGLVSFILQTKWLYQPILKLKNVTHQFSLGNYNVPLPKYSHDEVGELTQSIGQMRNKIQQAMEKLVNEEKMQRAILDSAPDAIITINKKGIILSFNPSAEKIFLYEKDEVVGKNIKFLMPHHVSEQHDQHLKQSALSSEPKILGNNGKLYGVKSDRVEFPMELTISASIIDGNTIFTGILRDITERLKVDKLKNEFISTVSHELRTPLTAIKGSLDIIMKGLNLDLPEQANSMLDIASRNVDRLLTLISDILDISKLESGEFTFSLENITTKEFLQDCVEINQEYAKNHNTEFKCTHLDEGIIVNVDKGRLIQVMSNLLSNAAKYSPKNIPVEIYTEVRNKTLRVNIKDYGEGIPEDFQSFLFEKFTQSSSGNTRQVGGTGLGLNISKMIIEKMGGEIGFDTIIDKQTIFYFELPIVN